MLSIFGSYPGVHDVNPSPRDESLDHNAGNALERLVGDRVIKLKAWREGNSPIVAFKFDCLGKDAYSIESSLSSERYRFVYARIYLPYEESNDMGRFREVRCRVSREERSERRELRRRGMPEDKANDPDIIAFDNLGTARAQYDWIKSAYEDVFLMYEGLRHELGTYEISDNETRETNNIVQLNNQMKVMAKELEEEFAAGDVTDERKREMMMKAERLIDEVRYRRDYFVCTRDADIQFIYRLDEYIDSWKAELNSLYFTDSSLV
eukprot:scaffold3394_cov23-Cyclotella_meneghiniana.AAC.7